MSFFDLKEDIMDIEMTQFGKYLLSKGKFKPEYYAFYDDDIIYDSSYNDVTEQQNDIGPRIKEAARSKAQYVFHGIETEYRQALEQIKAEGGSSIAMEQKPEKQFALCDPLGTSALTSEHAPAWEVTFLYGELSGSTPYLSSSADPFRPIPQIDATVTYETQYEAVDDGFEPDESAETNHNADDDPTEEGYELSIDEDFLLIEVRELNSDFLKDNFDIETYEVINEELVPLSFNSLGHRQETLDDVDVIDFIEEDLDQYFSVYDPSYVAYWMDLFADGEIDETLLCRLKREKSDNLFTDHNIDCDEVLRETGETNFGFVIRPEEDPGDIC